MRFKKQIIIICLFTFLFLPFQMNYKEIETKAEVLTMSYLTFEAITALLLATGIVITSNDTHNAFIQEVYNRNTAECERIAEQVANGERVSIGTKIAETIKEVYKLTFTDEVEYAEYSFPKVLSQGETIPSVLQTGSWVIKVVNGETYSPFFSTGYDKATQQAIFTISGFRNATLYNYELNTLEGVNLSRGTGFIAEGGAKCLTGSLITYFKGVLDWEEYRKANKDLNIDNNSSVLSEGSICADGALSSDIDKEFDNSKNYEYPLTDDQIGVQVSPDVLNPDDVLDKPSVDETDAPSTGDTLWDTLFGFLKTLFSPITNLLSSLWDLIKSLFDMLKGLLTSILDLLKSLLQSLIDAISALFVPTVAFEDIFKDSQKNFIGQIVDFFDFTSLWNIEPKPLEFNIKMPFYDFAKGERVPYEFDIKFFENKFMKENINLIRNVITYPILITTVYFIILHFMPKRDID